MIHLNVIALGQIQVCLIQLLRYRLISKIRTIEKLIATFKMPMGLTVPNKLFFNKSVAEQYLDIDVYL